MREKKQTKKCRRLLSLFLAVILMTGLFPAECILAVENEAAVETKEDAEITEDTEKPKKAAEQRANQTSEGEKAADTASEPDGEITADTEPDQSEEDKETVTYTNRLSGMLWLDMYDDIENSIYAGDGIRQPEESPLSGYTVELFNGDGRSNAVQTVETDADGRYIFENIEPGSYVVGVKTESIDGTEYLLPLYYLDGTEGDNRFVATQEDPDDEESPYTYAYTAPINIEADTVIEDMDAGMRMVPEAQTMATAGTPTVSGITYASASFSSGIYVGYTYSSDYVGTVTFQIRVSGTTTWTTASTYALNQSNITGITTFHNVGGSVSGLSPNTTYEVRVIAGDSTSGTGTFTTLPNPPTVSTPIFTGITQTAAIFNGTYNLNGGTMVVANRAYRYRVQGTSTWATVTGDLNYSAGNYSRTFAQSGIALTPNTTYEVQVYIENNGGGTWSGTGTFTTLPNPPTVSTPTFTGITQTAAIFNGTYDLNGGTMVAANRAYRYRVQGTSTWATVTGDLNYYAGGYSRTFAQSGIALTPNTTYEVQVYFENNGGGTWSGTGTFTTLPNPPTVSTPTVSNITQTNALIEGTYDLNGGTQVAANRAYRYRVQGTSTWATVTGDLNYYAGGYSKYFSASGITLTPNTTYEVQVYFENNGGGTWSGTGTFTTLPDFISWLPTGDTSDFTKATVSGSYAGTEEIIGATIIYGTNQIDVENDIGTLFTGAKDGSGDFIYSDTGFNATLENLTSGVYYVKTTVTNVTGTTESTVKSFLAGYGITEKFVDSNGSPVDSIGLPDNTIYVAGSYTASGISTSYTVGSDTYTYIGYKLDNYTTGDTLTSGTPSSVTITGDTTVYYVYTNLVDLTISKTVTGSYGDPNKAFAITITLEDGGAPVSGTYVYTGSAISGVTAPANANITFDTSGRGTIPLKHGQTITIKDIPQGYTYTVEETDTAVTGGIYTATYSGTGNVSSSGDSISDTLGSTTAAVSITNDRSTVPATGLSGTNYQLGAVGMLTVLVIAAIILWNYRRRRKCQ